MSGRGNYRAVYSSLVDDPDFQRLTPYARLTLVVVRLSPQIGAAGIFRYYTAVLAEQTGLDSEIVEAALAELAARPTPEAPWIYVEAGVLWVRNALRYDPNLRMADPKHRKSIERAVAGLPKLSIVTRFCQYYKIASPFDEPSVTLGGPSDDPSPPRPSSTPSTSTSPSTSADSRPPGSSNGLTHALSHVPSFIERKDFDQ